MALIHQAAALVAVIQAWIMLIHKRAVRRAVVPPLTYGPMMARDQERIANLNCVYNYNDTEVLHMLQMGRGPFFDLVKRFREGGLLQDNIHTSVEEQVAMFLHAVIQALISISGSHMCSLVGKDPPMTQGFSLIACLDLMGSISLMASST